MLGLFNNTRWWLVAAAAGLFGNQYFVSPLVPVLVVDRRVALAGIVTVALPASQAHAAADCYTDCLKNCRLIAPNDTAYCRDNCRDYCEQPDRQDGLSGSIGETGILGIGTVVKGQDKPPSISLPGLDFTTPKGKKLIGYD